MDTSPVRPPGADVVGRRVSVRHRTPDGSASDVVGRLLAAGPVLRLERRDGSVATVEAATVIIWRLVPDRPVRSRRATATPVDQLARIMARGWPALETAPLGEWQLRGSGGFTKRANSAAAFGDPGTDLDEALTQVQAFYADRGLRPLVALEAAGPWEAPLAARGWTPVAGGDTAALVAQLDRRWPLDAAAEVASDPDDAWLAAYVTPGESVDLARKVMTGAPTAAHLRLDGAIARVVVTGEWAGLSALWVPEEQRGRGLARRLVTTSLGWAVEQGADKAYLQVVTDNEPAERLYRTFGFVDHHEYRYLTLPEPGPPSS
ncbi:GNAT family N-acetyltransferase [Aeromicrobium sp.]|uniref:GNAT family N-acetyltransferase n=1 Tax=Aeromicrobium sp. TaxID=1871063 RepID=UPI0025C4FD38|nr:GNAT family N-acetyltransferase [Aeromicrobium sp.]MCK5891746.1 GNAT family N-acetyltransferase [Aeromicrobium sp.]